MQKQITKKSINDLKRICKKAEDDSFKKKAAKAMLTCYHYMLFQEFMQENKSTIEHIEMNLSKRKSDLGRIEELDFEVLKEVYSTTDFDHVEFLEVPDADFRIFKENIFKFPEMMPRNETCITVYRAFILYREEARNVYFYLSFKFPKLINFLDTHYKLGQLTIYNFNQLVKEIVAMPNSDN